LALARVFGLSLDLQSKVGPHDFIVQFDAQPGIIREQKIAVPGLEFLPGQTEQFLFQGMAVVFVK